jgi:hypothetical protein
MSDAIRFFSKIDMKTTDGKTRVVSEYPAWYFDHIKEELQENIRQNKFILENDRGITREKRIEVSQQLERMESKFSEIEGGVPEMNAVDKDKVAKARVDLTKQIKDSLFSRSQMQKGLADAHKEAKRMTEPCIKLSPEAEEVASWCGVKASGGKLNRNDATRVWKIVGKYLGEETNIEAYRKD